MVDLRSADPLDPDAYSMILRQIAGNQRQRRRNSNPSWGRKEKGGKPWESISFLFTVHGMGVGVGMG
jgi:hypothetical protein